MGNPGTRIGAPTHSPTHPARARVHTHTRTHTHTHTHAHTHTGQPLFYSAILPPPPLPRLCVQRGGGVGAVIYLFIYLFIYLYSLYAAHYPKGGVLGSQEGRKEGGAACARPPLLPIIPTPPGLDPALVAIPGRPLATPTTSRGKEGRKGGRGGSFFSFSPPPFPETGRRRGGDAPLPDLKPTHPQSHTHTHTHTHTQSHTHPTPLPGERPGGARLRRGIAHAGQDLIRPGGGSPHTVRISAMISAKEKPKPPKDSMTLLPCFYFVELPIVASSVVTLYFLELTDLFKPAKVGFQCYDRALSMPYVETNEEMIPLLMLLSLAFAAPAASIMVGEGIIYCLQSKTKGRNSSEGSINAGGCNFNSFLRRTVRFVGVHVFGLCATALVTDVIQLATGYHAPFFLTVCKPNYTLLGISCDANPYITQDICGGQDQHAILSARKTFPSQHATLSAFAAVYVSMYFNSIISDSTKLLKPILVFAFAIAAGICGLTQITQYRSHPVDVYAGFLIGAGIAAYLAYHAVGNFRAPPEKGPSIPPGKDALRALTQRGHDSVYHQNKSVSTDELNPRGRGAGASGPVPREKNSLGSLKRASVDVELLAPRSPMAKENMVTFSNTLPRVNTPSMDDPARRHMTIHVPVDASRSKQLITEWKQKAVEGRGMTLAEEVARRVGAEALGGQEEEEEEEDEEEEQPQQQQPPPHLPSSLYPTVQARAAERASMGPRVLIQPRPGATQLVHIPEESQANAGGAHLSPKSSSAVRAKWMMMAEKGAPPRVANPPPRLMQVIAMSKPPGMVSVTPKHSEATTSSSSTSSDSSQYRSPSERDSASVVTIDAHAPHHPVVHLSSGNGPWEWKAGPKSAAEGGPEGPYDLAEVAKDYRSFRPAKSAGVSPGSSVSDIEQDEPRYGSVATINVAAGVAGPLVPAEADHLLGAASRESTLRRKPCGPGAGVKEAMADEAESFYQKMQASRRFKD